MKWLLYPLIAVVLIILVAVFTLPNYLSTTSIPQPVEFEVPRGATLNYVAQQLFEEGVIRSRYWFKYKAVAKGIDKSIRPGTYLIIPDMTLEEIFTMLQRGNPEEPVVLTIPEGFTLFQMAQRVEALGFGTIEDFLTATEEYYHQHYQFATENLYFKMEGYLFPNTYFFTDRSTVEDIVSRMARALKDVFTDELKARAEELGLTKHEVLTIASIIEREAYHVEEKAAISGVIYNRLRIGMPLQIDATVIYGIGKGKEHISRVLYAHLEMENPFNTYLNRGLPPGPIAAPGKTSILAALYPEEHEYLYYVLGENGHVFGRTFQEHLINVESYRNLIRNRNR